MVRGDRQGLYFRKVRCVKTGHPPAESGLTLRRGAAQADLTL